MVKWSLQIPSWKNYFKAITKKISYTRESQEKANDYLFDCDRIAKEVCEELDLEFDRLPISDDSKIAALHYFQFKKFYDGNHEEFEETYLMDVIARYYNVGYGQFVKEWENVYENFLSLISKRDKDFKEGLKLAQKKNSDKLNLFKKLYKEYLK